MSAIQTSPSAAEIVQDHIDQAVVQEASGVPAVEKADGSKFVEANEESNLEAPGSKVAVATPVYTTAVEPTAAVATASTIKESTSTTNATPAPTTTESALKESNTANEPVATETVQPVIAEGTSVAAAAKDKNEEVKAKKDSPKKDKKPGFISRLLAQFSSTAEKVEHKVEHKKDKKSPKIEKSEAAATSAISSEAQAASSTVVPATEVVAPIAAVEQTEEIKEIHTASNPVEEDLATDVAPAETSESAVAPEVIEPVASTSEVKPEVKAEEAPATPSKQPVNPKMNRRLSARVSDLFKTHIGGPKKEKSSSSKKDETLAAPDGEATEPIIASEAGMSEEMKVSDSAPVLDAPATNAPIALGEVVPAADHQEEPTPSTPKPVVVSS